MLNVQLQQYNIDKTLNMKGSQTFCSGLHSIADVDSKSALYRQERYFFKMQKKKSTLKYQQYVEHERFKKWE